MKIRPYIEAVEGIKDVFSEIEGIDPQFYYLEEIEQTWRDDEASTKLKYKHHAVIAIGPEAVLFLISNPPEDDVHRIYSMILNPSVLIPKGENFCGIYLDINPEEQFYWIGRTVPEIKKLAILYDPANNSDFVDKAQIAGKSNGISVEPLKVSSKNEVVDVLRENWKKMDGLLLIPDATIINSTLVKYIIKDGISNKVPVIGYNLFFVRSGALLGFVYDYRDIGRQTASLAAGSVAGNRGCDHIPAQFQIYTNNRIAQQLDVNVMNHDKNRTFEED